jgi:hypothetical protein
MRAQLPLSDGASPPGQGRDTAGYGVMLTVAELR